MRYADDWVVFCESKEDAQAARREAQEWLLKRGLRLSEEKTRIVHLTEGFDFLGFNIRHYPAPNTARSGYKLLIKPSKESVRNFKERVRREWMALKGHNVTAVLKKGSIPFCAAGRTTSASASPSTLSNPSIIGCSIVACATSSPTTAAKGGDGVALGTGECSTPNAPTGRCSGTRAREPTSSSSPGRL